MKVYLCTPVLRDKKEYGNYINEFVEMLPEDSWIIVMDADTIFTTHYWYNQIHDAIEEGDALITAVTNRQYERNELDSLPTPNQIAENSDYDEHNIVEHYKLGRKLYKKYGSTLKSYKGGRNMGGFFMLFSKKVWKDSGGFKDEIKKADWDFHKKVKGKHPIKIMPGLYIYHARRLENDIFSDSRK